MKTSTQHRIRLCGRVVDYRFLYLITIIMGNAAIHQCRDPLSSGNFPHLDHGGKISYCLLQLSALAIGETAV